MCVSVSDAPDMDVVDSRAEAPNSASQLLAQGAGMYYCNGAIIWCTKVLFALSLQHTLYDKILLRNSSILQFTVHCYWRSITENDFVGIDAYP